MTFKKENLLLSDGSKYTTTLVKAKTLVPGFKEAFSRFEERLVLDRCSKSMFSNYSRNLAHLALHFGRVPHAVSVDEINTYLYRLTVHENYSVSFFKQTVFGLRFWFRLFDMESSEFLRRFCMHILPPKFVKMRHYGFLSNRGKEKLKIEQLKSGKIRMDKTKVDYKEITKVQLGFDIDACPYFDKLNINVANRGE